MWQFIKCLFGFHVYDGKYTVANKYNGRHTSTSWLKLMYQFHCCHCGDRTEPMTKKQKIRFEQIHGLNKK